MVTSKGFMNTSSSVGLTSPTDPPPKAGFGLLFHLRARSTFQCACSILQRLKITNGLPAHPLNSTGTTRAGVPNASV